MRSYGFDLTTARGSTRTRRRFLLLVVISIGLCAASKATAESADGRGGEPQVGPTPITLQTLLGRDAEPLRRLHQLNYLRPRGRTLSLLGDSVRSEEPVAVPSDKKPGPGVTYPLAPWLLANFKYKHALVFEDAHTRVIQKSPISGFSLDRDRDVLDFIMSWQRARNSLELGYRFESIRSGNGAVEESWLPGSSGMLHGLTLGVTRRWGGDP